MKCMICGGRLYVDETRSLGNWIMRKKHCPKCGRNCITQETEVDYVIGMDLMSQAYKEKRKNARNNKTTSKGVL